MIIVTHVIVAVLSMACATFGYTRPTSKNLQLSYGLVALTFATGFFMVWSEPVQILRTCLSGIAYLAVVLAVIALTRRKLSLLQSEQEA